MNRLYKHTGLTAVVTPVPTPPTPAPSIPLVPTPVVTIPVWTIVPDPTNTNFVNPLIGSGITACITSNGIPGFRLIQYYSNGTFSYASECMPSTGLNF